VRKFTQEEEESMPTIEMVMERDKRIAELDEWATDLEEAICKHRRDTWGDGPVQHPNDAELYAVLEK
jgi:hypothetical protein